MGKKGLSCKEIKHHFGWSPVVSFVVPNTKSSGSQEEELKYRRCFQFCANVFRTFDADGNGVIDFKVTFFGITYLQF